MNTIKDILIIVFLILQLTEAIYRVYSGDMEDRKVIFYLFVTSASNFHIIYIEDKTNKIKYIGGKKKTTIILKIVKRYNMIIKSSKLDSMLSSKRAMPYP